MDADASLESGLELRTKKVFESNLVSLTELVCFISFGKGLHCIWRCCHEGTSRYISGMTLTIVHVYSADCSTLNEICTRKVCHQVAREGKVDELLSLVQLESLENIRAWVNR